jgi:hypothetical protein
MCPFPFFFLLKTKASQRAPVPRCVDLWTER